MLSRECICLLDPSGPWAKHPDMIASYPFTISGAMSTASVRLAHLDLAGANILDEELFGWADIGAVATLNAILDMVCLQLPEVLPAGPIIQGIGQ